MNCSRRLSACVRRDLKVAVAVSVKPATAMAEFRRTYFALARTFAQRAFWACEIFRRAAALIFRRLRPGLRPGPGAVFPARASNRDCRRSICPFNRAMRFNWATERLNSDLVFIGVAF